jgi:hypothetical protein
MKNYTTMFFQSIPTQIKADFKSACARNRKTMRDVIIGLMQEYSAKAKANGRKG